MRRPDWRFNVAVAMVAVFNLAVLLTAVGALTSCGRKEVETTATLKETPPATILYQDGACTLMKIEVESRTNVFLLRCGSYGSVAVR